MPRGKLMLPALLLCLLLCACGKAAERSVGFFAMDTYMSVRAVGADEETLAGCRALAEEMEAKLSVTDADSEIAALNAAGRGVLSPETAELLRRALTLCGETEGALDVTVYPVVRAWGFTAGAYRVPTSEELTQLLQAVDYRGVEITGEGTVLLPPGAELDLGSVAKGYAGDRLCAYLREKGVKSAILDLGGNVQALGGKADGSPWRVGIRDPDGDGMLGVVSIRDEAAVTSGGYERFFTDAEGRVWWHIIDPETGYPARNGLLSVTVVGPEGLRCDALSTALFIMGQEKAEAFWRADRGFELALVTEDGVLRLTPGLYTRFEPAKDLRCTLEVIPDA